MLYTRRDLGKIALGALPFACARGAAYIDSKFYGVQIGAITYSFNSIANPDTEAIIRAYVEIGLGEAELMSNHCEALAGAPPAASRSGRGARRGGDARAAGGQASPAGTNSQLARVGVRFYLEECAQQIQRCRH